MNHLCSIAHTCLFQVLFLNPTFILVTLATVFDSMLINGFAYFGPKYLENQFSISASAVGMIFGKIYNNGTENKKVSSE